MIRLYSGVGENTFDGLFRQGLSGSCYVYWYFVLYHARLLSAVKTGEFVNREIVLHLRGLVLEYCKKKLTFPVEWNFDDAVVPLGGKNCFSLDSCFRRGPDKKKVKFVQDLNLDLLIYIDEVLVATVPSKGGFTSEIHQEILRGLLK